MRRVFVLALVLVAGSACGKSRVRGDENDRWDDPTGASGFHGGDDAACTRACFAKSELDRRRHAVRTKPEARVVATLEEPSRVGLVFMHSTCLEGASQRDWQSGCWWCVDPNDGTSVSVAEHGPPSSMIMTNRSMVLATRDVNGRSSVQIGKGVLAEDEKDVRALAAHGDDVCWIDANERVRCAHENGIFSDARSSVRTVARAPGIDARFLTMDGQAFYVVRGDEIATLPRDGGRLEVLAKAASPIRDLVFANGHLYWTEQGEPRMECLPDGTMPRCTARGRVIRYPSGSIRSIALAHRERETVTLAKDVDAVDALFVTADHAYASMGQGLLRVPLGGASATPTVLPTRDPAFGRPALDPVTWTVYVQTRKNAEPAKVMALEP